MSNSTRPSSSNSYDERFVVPLEASRRGAHRARVSPLMAILPVAAVVGTVVGAIALVYVFLGGTGGSDAGADATTNATPSATSSATASGGPAASGSVSPTGDGSSSSTLAPGSVDTSIVLDVFNGTSTSGLAKKAGTKLIAAGWTTGRIETWTGSPVAQTTVYYGHADQKASAQAIVKALGRGTAKLSPSKAGTGMAVVIGNDYPGAGTGRPVAPTATSTGGASRSSTKTAGASTTGASGSTDPRRSTGAGRSPAAATTSAGPTP